MQHNEMHFRRKPTSMVVAWAVDSTDASVGMCGTMAWMTADKSPSASALCAAASVLLRTAVASSRRRSKSAM